MGQNYLVALQQAQAAAESNAKGTLTQQGRLDAVVALAEWGVFSARNVSTFTGMSYAAVRDIISNPDRKGGRITVAALPHLISLIRLESSGKIDVNVLRAAIDAGASLTFVAKLTGLSHTTLHRRLDGKGASA